MKKFFPYLVLLFSFYESANAQAFLIPQPNNNARQLSCQCYQLTADSTLQAGAIWNQNALNLNNPFDFKFNIYLGNHWGADGLMFVIQNLSNGITPSLGGGLGYAGLPGRSIGIEFDTFDNGAGSCDIAQNHIAIDTNGVNCPNLIGPVSALPSGATISDGLWHTTEIVWNPAAQTLAVYFDGNLRIGYIFPAGLINTIFHGQNLLYWGWTGSTGGLTNVQQVCSYFNTSFTLSGGGYTHCGVDTISFLGHDSSSLNNIVGYYWNFGDGNISHLANPSHTYAASGNYTVTLIDTDQTLCTDTVTHQIRVDVPTNNVAQTNASCFGSNTGSAIVTLTSGIVPYRYTWSPSVSATNIANNLTAGTYMVTVADSAGCTVADTFNITQPTQLTASQTHVNVSCFGQATGSIIITASGGTAGYTYRWVPNVSGSNTANNVVAGSYNITVTDAHNCTVSQNVTVTQPAAALTLSASQVNGLCFGQSNASATVTASGGTGPYSYNWNTIPVQNTATATNLPAGSYSVTVTDANSCTATQSFTITQPNAPLAVTVTPANVQCFGLSTGSITSNASGGSPGYSYSWSTIPVQNTANATNLVAGNYTLTVTDTYNCTVTASAVITQPTSALTGTVSETNVLCHGLTTGTATANVSGGTPGYTYSWNSVPPQSSASALALPAGVYIVTISDANNCTISIRTTITQPAAALTLASSQVNIPCFGENNGSATVVASGGTAGYTYSWNTVPVQTTATISNIQAGTYSVTVTDANLCTITTSFNITQPPTGLTVTVTPTAILCFGQNTGTITSNATGGSPVYTYSWNTLPVQTTANATNLTAGNYTVTVTDASNCSASASAAITQPASALTGTINATNVACLGQNTGSATITANGGTGAYTYNWNTVPVQNTATANNITAGTYTVTVTDANSCTITASTTITQPASALSLSQSQVNIMCYGDFTGSATVVASGGTTAYSYNWNTVPVQTTATISNIQAGTYSVTVTDANLCTITTGFNITQPPTGLTVTVTPTAILCFGQNTGTITSNATGGSPVYTYSWNTLPVQTTANATNLTAGNYTVTVTDASNCSASASAAITQPASALTGTINATNVACFGQNTGSATITANGGTGAYTYNWNTIPVQNTATANNITAGTYTVTVTDANSCTITASTTITQPASALSLSQSQVNIMCYGDFTGSATVVASGGTTAYSYNWNTVPVQTTATISNIQAGTYSVTVTDANLCTITTSFNITQPPTGLTVTVTPTAILCFGQNTGTITSNATGGSPVYTYSWNTLPVQTTANATNLTAGNYTVTVTDASNCSASASAAITQPASALTGTINATNVACLGQNTGSATITANGGTGAYTYNWNTVPVQNTATANNITAGTYTVTVTDANSCTITASTTITQPASALSLSQSQVNIMCYGDFTGSATVVASGGTTAYSYNWNTVPVQTTATISNIQAGTYSVTVTDANLCTITTGFNITQPPTGLTVTVTPTAILCFGQNTGTITSNATGGSPVYTYSWNTLPVQTTANATNLTAGNYTVTVTDASNCSASASAAITQPASALTGTINATNVACFGQNTGSATITANGGTGAYTYNWNTIPVQNTATANNITAGTYTVTVTDANSCTITASTTITQPASALSLSQSQVNIMCYGDFTGSATVVASGGTTAYSYNWNTVPVQTTATISNIQAGTYSVTVTDANLCTITTGFNITQPPSGLTVTVTPTAILCFGQNTGTITSNATGGSPVYTYSWNTLPVQTTANATNLTAGNYTVTVTDASNCSASASAAVTQPNSALNGTISETDVVCYNEANGTAAITATGGTPSYSYTWNSNPPQIGPNATSLLAGTYNVTITDANNCSFSQSVTINQPPALSLSATSTPVLCYGQSNGQIIASATGGVPGYSYYASAPAIGINSNTGQFNNLAAAVYTVMVTDQNSCTVSVQTDVVQPTQLMATETQVNVLCNGLSTGAINLTTTGGVAGYMYAWSPNVSADSVGANLPSGNYSITITDNSGCSITQSATITQPPVLTVNASASGFICSVANSGVITASAAGGTPGYDYTLLEIGHGNVTSLTGQFNNIGPANYVVVVTDQNMCVDSTPLNVNLSPALIATVNVIPPTCFGFSNAQLIVDASGGLPSYTYTFAGGASNSSGVDDNLQAGTYIITIADAGGCVLQDTITITQPDAVNVAVNPSPVQIKLGGLVQLSTTTNQAGMVNYAWSPDVGLSCYDCASPVFNNLYSQNYKLVITNENGCSGETEFEATVIANYDFFVPNVFSPNNDGSNDYWQLFGNTSAIKQIEVLVFNKIGEKVFESDDVNFKWDGTYKGKPAAEGVYSYVTNIVWLDNHVDNSVRGSITLLR